MKGSEMWKIFFVFYFIGQNPLIMKSTEHAFITEKSCEAQLEKFKPKMIEVATDISKRYPLPFGSKMFCLEEPGEAV